MIYCCPTNGVIKNPAGDGVGCCHGEGNGNFYWTGTPDDRTPDDTDAAVDTDDSYCHHDAA
jgi:hypothetical protein